ncbi:LD-carboxypeptidase [Patescibacteria group bacterium]|nr:LD-carboxypeptidase [Patescibacteria group bacterium]
MIKLPKLKSGDKVAVLSPSFAGAGRWPVVYELGLKRLEDIFGLIPVEYPSTRKIGASAAERTSDLVSAFSDPAIKAVFATIGGDDQVTYIKNLTPEPFVNNPKPFFGYSDNSHFANFMFLQGIPSYYGGSILTQFAMQGEMDSYTIEYLKRALFEEGRFQLKPSETFNDQGLGWDNIETLAQYRTHWPNNGYIWDGTKNTEGVLWGGCLESVDEMLRHAVPIPSLTDFENIILMLETSEELPTSDYVRRVIRALGERGVLAQVKAVLVGRAKAWEFDKQNSETEKEEYRKMQQETILNTIRKYNPEIPVIQNMNFGHTDPQIPMPYGNHVHIDSDQQKIWAQF